MASRAIALDKSPDSFTSPFMKAVAGFSSLLNICRKTSLFRTIVTSGLAAGSPDPMEPSPFLRSTCHFPSPSISNTYTALTFLMKALLVRLLILSKTGATSV